MSQKKKKKLGSHKPQKNKPAKTKNNKELAFGQQPIVTRMTLKQPNRVDISIFISSGRISRKKSKEGHKGNLRRG
jgi:hypothetical protein